MVSAFLTLFMNYKLNKKSGVDMGKSLNNQVIRVSILADLGSKIYAYNKHSCGVSEFCKADSIWLLSMANCPFPTHRVKAPQRLRLYGTARPAEP